MNLVADPTSCCATRTSFLGGQRQRIGIARAMANNPTFVVRRAGFQLDVSIQAQVINLFEDLQSEFNLTYLSLPTTFSISGISAIA